MQGTMKIKSYRVIFLIIFSLFTFYFPSAFADESNSVISTLRDSVLSYFHPVNGVITKIEGNNIIITLSSDKKFNKGTRLSVFREGRHFYHPVTGEAIGKIEEFIGKIEINEATEDGYLCRIIIGSPEAGDKVRITSSRIKLAFFQDRNAEWHFSEAFYNSLKDTGRFDLIESRANSNDPSELSKLARDLGAEAVLFFSTPARGKNIFLNFKLFWSEDASVFAEIEDAAGMNYIKELAHESEFIPAASSKSLPSSSFELEGGELIAIGDVDGNGVKELIVSDGNNIRIYSFKKELQDMWFLKGSPLAQHLSVDASDLNHNGRAEIFVTSLRGDDIQSFVLEYDPSEGYKEIFKTSNAIRVIGNTLFMQAFTPSRGFTGPLYKAAWKDNSYQIVEQSELPEGFSIYGFTYVDWKDSGDMDILAFDDNGYLNLFKKNNLIWRSKESYGRFDIAFQKKTYSSLNPEEYWYVKSRLSPVRTAQGQEIIAVKKIPYISSIPGLGYKKAEVYSLWWDGEIMHERLILNEINGKITDYIVDGDNLLVISKTNLSRFLSKALSGDIAKGSMLYNYEIKK